jgi:hypothetical protein
MNISLEGKTPDQKKSILKTHRKTFNDLIKAAQITDHYNPMIKVGQNNSDYEHELNLWNPYSPITCFILYLYSLELGNPTLYSDLNGMVRKYDANLNKHLGSIAQCLVEITYDSEENRHDDDKIPSGF